MTPSDDLEPGELEPLVVVTTPTIEGRAVLRLEGELDMYNAPQLRSAFDDVMAGGAEEIEVDFAAVTFIDSSGLGCLIDAHRALVERGGRLVLGSRSDVAERLFSVSGVEQVLESGG